VRHRVDLAHEVMVKDNHWQALRLGGGALADALAEARARGFTSLQVEVESAEQVEQACAAGATRLLVDNQTPEVVKAWSARARESSPGIEIEATGRVTLANVRAYAEAGADFVSVGALTHSVVAADLGIEVAVRSATPPLPGAPSSR
jgi:nicotinate-nucleotide pyrophosphorylase (carboxylating)